MGTVMPIADCELRTRKMTSSPPEGDDTMGSLAFEHQCTVGGYITFTIRVISGSYSGASSFCISESLLKDAISSLRTLYDELQGTYQMNDYDSDDFILFEFRSLGHVEIAGQVGGSFSDQYLRYRFLTDQTVLAGVISAFRGMVA